MRKLKRDWTADLFTKRGQFWEQIRARRKSFGITPITQVPPPGTLFVYLYKNRPQLMPQVSREVVGYAWLLFVRDLRGAIVPRAYSSDYLKGRWNKFLSACLLYDPPETDLLAFAAIGEPTTGTDSTRLSHRSSALPIVRLADPNRLRDDTEWFYRAALDRIGERFLEPLGLDIWSMHETVIREERYDDEGSPTTSLKSEYGDRVLKNEFDAPSYIFVTEETTEDDVIKASRSIKGSMKHRGKGGRSSRDRLTAIQCAVFYKRHNGTDPQDARRKKWSYGKLAEKFRLPSADSAKGHVGEGSESLKAKPEE